MARTVDNLWLGNLTGAGQRLASFNARGVIAVASVLITENADPQDALRQMARAMNAYERYATPDAPNTYRYAVTIRDAGNITNSADNVRTILTSPDHIAPAERVDVEPLPSPLFTLGEPRPIRKPTA